jgi:HSP20 family protein
MTNDPNKSSKRSVAPRYSDPFSALRADMDSLFDSFIGGLPAFSGMFGSSGGRGFALTPHMDVKDSDKEILVEAELPVIDEKDVSYASGRRPDDPSEKKHERDEEKENYRTMEPTAASSDQCSFPTPWTRRPCSFPPITLHEQVMGLGK